MPVDLGQAQHPDGRANAVQRCLLGGRRGVEASVQGRLVFGEPLRRMQVLLQQWQSRHLANDYDLVQQTQNGLTPQYEATLYDRVNPLTNSVDSASSRTNLLDPAGQIRTTSQNSTVTSGRAASTVTIERLTDDGIGSTGLATGGTDRNSSDDILCVARYDAYGNPDGNSAAGSCASGSAYNDTW